KMSQDDPTNHRNRLDLSVAQVVASAFAAVTATVGASFLGVAGTVIGAAVASVLTVVANAIYLASLHRTRDRLAGLAPAPTGSRAPPRASTNRLARPPVAGRARRPVAQDPRSTDPLASCRHRGGSRVRGTRRIDHRRRGRRRASAHRHPPQPTRARHVVPRRRLWLRRPAHAGCLVVR